MDTEQQIRLNFLDEARDYLDEIETTFLGLADAAIEPAAVDAALRAAHSIKGGAAMMGFESLSHFAHQLEDSLKILRVRHESLAIDTSVQTLLLQALDCLRQIEDLHRRELPVSPPWLQEHGEPIFQQLRDRFGDVRPEDETALLSQNEGVNVSALIFDSEVEEKLQHLESAIAAADPGQLQTELATAVDELAGLGQMLQLDAFTRLCQGVGDALSANPDRVTEIAAEALQTWRRSQALVTIGQTDALPDRLENFAARDLALDDFSDLGAALAGMEIPEEMGSADFSDLGAALEGLDSADFSELGAALEGVEIPAASESPTMMDAAELADLQAAIARLDRETAAFETPEPEPDPAPAQSQTVLQMRDPVENTVRIPVRQLEQLDRLFGELLLERNTLNLRLGQMRSLVKMLRDRLSRLDRSNRQLRRLYDTLASEDRPTGDNRRPDFDALEMDRYSDVHLLSQEQMETVVQLQEVASDIELDLQEIDQAAAGFNHTTKQLQGNVARTRMRPLSTIVGRFPRVVRDLCVQYGKQADLDLHGSNLLVDRALLDALSDPLMHLLRNAFDHGIEDPETRSAAGKPPQGRIAIRAESRGNQIAIAISDDGKGIDPEQIRARARRMGFDEGRLASATEAELLDLIFEPGFSTADRVTELSGRGVGMDVVRHNLQPVRGTVSVETVLGRGTTFTLRLPLNLSVVRALLVESNGFTFAVPTDAIAEMVRYQPISDGQNEWLVWQEQRVPVLAAARGLTFNSPRRLAQSETAPAIDRPVALVFRRRELGWRAVQVDRFWDELELSVREVASPLPLPSGFSGCSLLGDGRVVPLAEPNQLWDCLEADPQARPSSPPAELPTETTILVVDDSVNVRRYLTTTLEKGGYRVEQAKDGREAIDKLQAGLRVQAMICDLEMPRLDGYGVLAQVKSDPNLKSLPVAMLTSRSSEKHRKLAMNLGASAYFSKPYNEQQLLQTLQKLLETDN